MLHLYSYYASTHKERESPNHPNLAAEFPSCGEPESVAQFRFSPNTSNTSGVFQSTVWNTLLSYISYLGSWEI